MKIGVVSDSHDHGAPLAAAVARARDWGAQAILHCGDIIGPNSLRSAMAVGLIGHSMGAIVVQRALRRAKARAMALLAPVPPQGLLGSSFMLAASNPEIFNEINKIQIFDGLAGSPDLLRQAIFSQRLPPAEVKRYLRRMRHESQRALFDLSWPRHFWIERTTIPVHVIGAADDMFFPPSLVEATAGLHGIDAEIVPDIAHALMLDANWEHTARGLAAWLERSLR